LPVFKASTSAVKLATPARLHHDFRVDERRFHRQARDAFAMAERPVNRDPYASATRPCRSRRRTWTR
jgi:hypothetical protein